MRLSTLQAHIQEVANAISTGDYTIEGRSVSKKILEDYLALLMKREIFEGEQVGLTQGTRLGFTSLRARRRP